MRSSRILLIAFFLMLLLPACQLDRIQPQTPPAGATMSAQPTYTALPPTALHPTTTPTPTEIVCKENSGKIVNIDIPTEYLKHPVNTNIYLPPCYDPESTNGYPVLYMFHGQAATNDQWIRLGLTTAADQLIEEEKIQPLIIVMPFEATWTPGPADSTFDEAVLNDVLPYVEKDYAICKARTCRAVGGLSRGGNWAVYLGFAHPDLFGLIGAHSTPLFYGEVGRIRQAVADPARANLLPRVEVDLGDHDTQKDKVLEFTAALQETGVSFDFYQYEGRHEESYWSAHVTDYLLWYSDHFLIPPENQS
jgi:enterochelin esterase-like enzyme